MHTRVCTQTHDVWTHTRTDILTDTPSPRETHTLTDRHTVSTKHPPGNVLEQLLDLSAHSQTLKFCRVIRSETQ